MVAFLLLPFTGITAVVAKCIVFILSLFGHTIRVDRIHAFALYDLRYSNRDTHETDAHASSSSAHFAFHIPCRSDTPHWGMLTVNDIYYSNPHHQLSITKLHIRLCRLPFLSMSGPWASVELHDFRLRVFNSADTPDWVATLRKYLVRTVLTGSYLRLDDIKTTLRFDTLTCPVNDTGITIDKSRKERKDQLDDVRISVSSRNCHIRNWQERIVRFSKLDTQLRRSWLRERGSFVIIVEDGRWTLVHDRTESIRSSPWQCLQAIPHLSKFLRVILTTIDLQVSQCNITFDEFRIRDAELLTQGATLIGKQKNALVAALSDFFLDTLFATILA